MGNSSFHPTKQDEEKYQL